MTLSAFDIPLKTKLYSQIGLIVFFVLLIGVGLSSTAGFVNASFERVEVLQNEVQYVHALSNRTQIVQTLFTQRLAADAPALRQQHEVLLATLSNVPTTNYTGMYAHLAAQLEKVSAIQKKALVTEGVEQEVYVRQAEGLAQNIAAMLKVAAISNEDALTRFTNVVRMQLKTIGFLVLGSVMCAALLTMLFSIFITMPTIERMRTLVTTIVSYSKGTHAARTAVDGTDEVGTLALNYNHMIDVIEEQTHKLTSMNESLNVQVQDRTASLHEELYKTKQLSQEIMVQKGQLELVLNSIGDMMFVCAGNGALIRTNELAGQLLSYEGVLLKTLSHTVKFMHPLTKEEFFPYTELIESKALKRLELPLDTELITTQGTPITLEGTFSKVSGGASGEQLVFIGRDTTHKRNLERIRNEFASVASHQMRTPLTGIKWQSELLIKDVLTKLTKPQQELLTGIHEQNDRMIELVNDLLRASQLASLTGAALNYTRQSVDALVKSIISELAEYLIEHQVTTTTDLPENIQADIDSQYMRHVIYNLFTNAVKYSRTGGVVHVTLSLDKHFFILAVKDAGIGIPEAEHIHIFERFYRAENARSKVTDGNGLGLYIVKAVTELHDGTIWFESVLDQGTTFYVKIPLVHSVRVIA
jgi:signal transduction histidine kinase